MEEMVMIWEDGISVPGVRITVKEYNIWMVWIWTFSNFQIAWISESFICEGAQGNSVIVVTSIWAGQARDQGLIPGRGKRFFSPPQHPEWLWGLILWVLGDKTLGGWSWLLPSSAEVKNGGAVPPLSICFQSVVHN
jgi:hypothetical protein